MLSNLRNTIANCESRLRVKYPILKYQNAIGLTIMLTAAMLVIFFSVLYVNGYISAIVCILANAFFISFLHELEHDTFHRQYFKHNRYMRNAMLLFCWLFKPNTIYPWIRKKIHFHHHRYSGTPEDIEEQLIGNGLRYGPKRFLVMLDPLFATLQFPRLMRNSHEFSPLLMMLSGFPLVYLFDMTWISWGYLHLATYLNAEFALSLWLPVQTATYLSILNMLMVIIILPNMLRVFCLQFISSSMHYFGNVTNVLEQTQVLNHWLFIPLQTFCMDFGATHGIHHIYLPQPFYIRHIIRKECYPIMREHGVRFNDFKTFISSNEYQK